MPEAEPDGPPEPAAGSLLVATPLLVDPNFVHAVVLLLDVDDDGALGVVLNRPSPVPVGDLLADWTGLVTPPSVLFRGGPVGTDSALAVGRLPGAPGEDPVGFRRLYGEVGIVDLDAPTELFAEALGGLRIFAGYAGWGREQLAAEIAEGSWYVVPAEPGDLCASRPDGQWQRVLRRQPGELAWVSTRPADPTLN